MVRIEKHDDFEFAGFAAVHVGFRLRVRFSKKFQFLSNKLYSFAVRAVYGHHVGFQFDFIATVNPLNEFADEGLFA
jgi:hypothetical protein